VARELIRVRALISFQLCVHLGFVKMEEAESGSIRIDEEAAIARYQYSAQRPGAASHIFCLHVLVVLSFAAPATGLWSAAGSGQHVGGGWSGREAMRIHRASIASARVDLAPDATGQTLRQKVQGMHKCLAGNRAQPTTRSNILSHRRARTHTHKWHKVPSPTTR